MQWVGVLVAFSVFLSAMVLLLLHLAKPRNKEINKLKRREKIRKEFPTDEFKI